MGYNNGVADAARTVAEVIEAEACGDERILALGVKMVVAIARLKREQRHRRTRSEMEAARELSQLA